MTSRTGTCRFCMQTKLIEVPDDMSQEEIDEEVTMECRCKDGEAYRDEQEKIEMIRQAKLSAQGTTFELFHEEFPEIEEVLNYVMDDLTSGAYKKVTITTGGKTKASITFQKDTIVVVREDKNTYTRETEI